MKIRIKNGKVDAKHLQKQIDREEQRWQKMLNSGKYEGSLREIIMEQLQNLEKLRAKFSPDESKEDKSS
jgi:hypothetical protein